MQTPVDVLTIAYEPAPGSRRASLSFHLTEKKAGCSGFCNRTGEHAGVQATWRPVIAVLVSPILDVKCLREHVNRLYLRNPVTLTQPLYIAGLGNWITADIDDAAWV